MSLFELLIFLGVCGLSIYLILKWMKDEPEELID